MERVRGITKGLADDEEGGFRSGKIYINQIFTLKQLCETAREK